MARQILTRAPLGANVLSEFDEGKFSQDWSAFVAQLADEVFRRYKVEQTLNPNSVGANTTSEQTFTVTGLNTNDVVRLIKPSHTTGLGIVNVRVSAADTLAVTFMNTTAGAIDPPSETYTIFVMRV